MPRLLKVNNVNLRASRAALITGVALPSANDQYPFPTELTINGSAVLFVDGFPSSNFKVAPLYKSLTF